MRTMSLTTVVLAASSMLVLGACSADPDETASPSPSMPAPGEIRPAVDGATTAEVAQGMRLAFPDWPELSDDEVVAAMNAGCDGLDAQGTPGAGVEAIAAYGINEADAAFTLLASITTFCPEHSNFLYGSE